MNKKFSNIRQFLKNNYLWVICFFMLSTIGVLLSLYLIGNEIEESYKKIDDDITYGIFENKKRFGISGGSYTIVGFSKDTVPQKEFYEDSSKYAQQYGNIKSFYKVTKKGWVYQILEKVNGEIIEFRYEPWAVGFENSYSNYNPDEAFRELYKSIANDEDNNIDVNNTNRVSKLNQCKSKFHEIKIEPYSIFSSLMWYDYYWGKAYASVVSTNKHIIVEKDTKILAFIIVYISISLITSLFVTFLIRRIYKKNIESNKNLKKKSFNLGVSITKSSENMDSRSINVDNLLEMINPTNFISPYDSEKVKIANDLYSALINSKDNDTIVEMIKNKAVEKLGIKL